MVMAMHFEENIARYEQIIR